MAMANGYLPAAILDCGWRQGADGGAVWSSKWRAATTNCEESEVVVCDAKGPCSVISICAVDAGGDGTHLAASSSFAPKSRCSGTTQR